MRDQDKFRGCLIGGAAGDALGYAVELMSEEQIIRKYGPKGILGYDLSLGAARISDDTQMTLFTATGLLGGTTRGLRRGIHASYTSYINDSYKDWLRTQTEIYPLKPGHHYSWLVNVPGMFVRRTPEVTCISALRRGGGGTTQHAISQGTDGGGLTRVAPVGLYFCDRMQWIDKEVDKIGAEVAALTHGHPVGWLPAAAHTHIIRKIVQDGLSVERACLDALEKIGRFAPGNEALPELKMKLEMAMDFASKPGYDLTAIHRLGEGKTAPELLAIAVYCSLRYPDDFDRALIASVNHRGASDSSGTLTGNIMGARLGYRNLPSKYTQRIEMQETILEIADDLWQDCSLDSRVSLDPIWERKYVDMVYEG